MISSGTVSVAATCAVLAAAAAALPRVDGEVSDTRTVLAAAPSPGSNAETRYVVAVSVDGLNPAAIRKLGPKGAPALHRLMRQGASTLDARTAVEATTTLPNHAGMLTGRRVKAAAGGHGYTANDDDARTTLHRNAGSYVASLFDVVHDRGGDTALYTSKDKFALFNRSYNAVHGAPDTVGKGNGRDKIDAYRYLEDEPRLVSALLADLGDGPKRVTFLHLSSTDKVGHAHGYMSDSYLAAVNRVDRQVGRIVNRIAGDDDLADRTTLVLTSDHGGRGYSHADPTKPYNYTVPFLVWGPNSPAGVDLYDLNPDFEHPGDARVRYTKARQPVRNAALGNLVTDLLGMPPVPGSTVNTGQELRATR